MNKSILGYALKREIRMTTSAITGRKLDLSFAGDGAWTTRTQMRLPAVHDAQLYDIDDARVLRGYADHEAGHHRYTPFDVIDQLQKRRAGVDIDDPTVNAAISRPDKIRHVTTFNIWNAAEDYRIERNDMRDLPGTRKNLDATRRHVLRREEGIFDANLSRMDDPYAMASAAFTWLNACENRYSSAPLAQALLAKLSTQNPYVHSLAIAKWPEVLAASELDDASANEGIYKVASDVCDAIMAKYPPEDPAQPPSTPGSGANQKPTPGDCEKGDGDGGSAPSPSADPSKDDGAGAGDAKSGQGHDQADSNNGASTDDDAKPSAATDRDVADSGASSDCSRQAAIEKAAREHQPEKCDQLDISDIAKRIAKVSDQMPGGIKAASERPLSENVVRSNIQPHRTDLAHYNGVRNEISGVTSALAGAMRAIVIAKDRRKIRPNRDEGDLDMGNVAGLALRSPDIYEQQRVSPANHTSIDFLLDISLSMTAPVKIEPGTDDKRGKRTNRINLLMQSLIALTEALGPARRVRTRYIAFSTHQDNVKLYLIKDYHQGLTETKHQLDLVMDGLSRNLIPMGSTPTGQAMLDAWSDQRGRKENKKIQIILTDGEPDDDNIEIAEQAAETIKRDGGHAIGIGIGGNQPNFRMDKWVLVPEISKLPTEILGSLKTLLK